MALYVDPTDPNFVTDGTRQIPISLVDPADIGPAPGAVAPTPAAAPPAPAMDPVDEALSKLEVPAVSAYTRPRGLALAGANVQRGVNPNTVAPMIEATRLNTAEQVVGIKERATEKQAALEAINARETELAAQSRFQAEQAMAENKAKRESARKQELALRDQKDPTIDPDQFMKENGLAMVLLAGLSGALGAVAKDGGRGGEQFLGVVERRIDKNIAAQKAQVESGRVRRGNLIDYYMKEGLDAKEAEQAAKGVYYAQAARYVELEKERAALPDIAANADAVIAQLNGAAQDKINALALASEDKVSEAYARPAPAASAKPSEVLKEVEATRDLDQLKKSGLKQNEFDKQKNEYSEKALKNDDLVTKAQEVVSALGGKVKAVRDKDGNVERYVIEGELDTPHFGDEATQYETATSNLQRADVMGMAREPSAKLQDDFAKATEMPFRDSQKKVRLQQILDLAVRERDKLRGGYNPHVTQSVDSAKTPDRNVPGSWK